VIKYLKDAGNEIAFDGTTGRLLSVVTIPKEEANEESFYRIRLNIGECGPETCPANLTANRVTVRKKQQNISSSPQALANLNQASQEPPSIRDDNVTTEIRDYIIVALKASDERMRVRQSKSYRVPRLFDPFGN
jgi:hypothetical protein